MRSKRGRAWSGPTRQGRLPSSPTLFAAILSPWQPPPRYWRGPRFESLGSASSGSLGGDRLGLIGRFTSPLIGRDGAERRSGVGAGGKGRNRRVAGFKMAPASLGDVEGRPWVRPSLLEKQGADVGLARRVDGAAVGLRRWC